MYLVAFFGRSKGQGFQTLGNHPPKECLQKTQCIISEQHYYFSSKDTSKSRRALPRKGTASITFGFILFVLFP